MITYHDLEQGTEEWLKLRMEYITATKFGVVLSKGAGRKTYMLEKIAEMLTGHRKENYTNPAMEWGTQTEPQARAHYEFMRDVDVAQAGFVTNDKYPGAGISPDGMVGYDGLIEIKCPNTTTHLDYIIRQSMPAKYKPQVQGQLWITERQWCDFVSFDPRVMDPDLQMFVVRVHRDDEYISGLAKSVADFKSELDEMLNKLGAKK
jgi:putative phage-type endonuclease